MLVVNNLTKSFGTLKVLSSVSFDVKEKEVLAIIGKSGCGKTTLLRILNNLESFEEGEISDCTFGLVFQDFNLFPQYTVLKNLTLAPKLLKKPTKQAQKILDDLNLSDKTNSYISQLSGGQKQRVAIARALMLNPDILCLDEPTSSLDKESTKEVINVLKDLKCKQSMIIVSHNMTVVKELADRVLFMKNCKLTEYADWNN